MCKGARGAMLGDVLDLHRSDVGMLACGNVDCAFGRLQHCLPRGMCSYIWLILHSIPPFCKGRAFAHVLNGPQVTS